MNPLQVQYMQNTNFLFLKQEWPDLYKKAYLAEQRVRTEPMLTGLCARVILEIVVKELFQQNNMMLPSSESSHSNLSSLIYSLKISRVIPQQYEQEIKIIRTHGNDAAHNGKLSSKKALESIKYLYGFLKWFAQRYSTDAPDLPGSFNGNYVPKVGAAARKARLIKEEYERALKRIEAEREQYRIEKEKAEEAAKETEAKYQAYLAELAEKQAKLNAQLKERSKVVIAAEFTEAETRKHLIDIALREAGWAKLRQGIELEFPVKYMPISRDNPNGNGFVDYVLWGDNGKPLMIVEAKRTSTDVVKAQHQAKLYADCLEKMYEQRPVICYSNGYETYIWDDCFYAETRRIHGFYTKDELEWMIQQRSTRQDIRTAQVDKEIAGRPYQMKAIQRVAEAFVIDAAKSSKQTNRLRGHKREALLVMATGSGKTRTAAALVKVLLKYNWVKKVLFLADRNALVSQAKKSFGEHLPNVSSIDLTKDKEDSSTRLVFSTYPTMMNRIEAIDKGERFYGIGHFDLIIIDEAHRSVYNKYKAIFEYFDSLILGLTATPKQHVDTNTYKLFKCPNNDPTFFYELNEAVAQDYLVDYHRISATTEFMRSGIKYKKLNDEQKKAYEETFMDSVTGAFPEEIKSSALNKWLFNKDTVNKVLDALMQFGLKIEGNDKLGRTIIFATNQRHANFILKCFNERYPDYDGDFAQLIYNGVSHVQSIITQFCDKEEEHNPQIAISVDMMDTGIDAPRVLNLVFFKIVRSYAKFWQMIGRGTRLCPDVFGPKKNKERFYIFDACQNFEFFEENPNGRDGKKVKSLTEQLFVARLHLSVLLQQEGTEDHITLANTLLDQLHDSIKTLNQKRIEVSMQKRYVDKFYQRAIWSNLNKQERGEIEEHLAPLPMPEKVHEKLRRFDLMMLKMAIAKLLTDNKQEQHYTNSLLKLAELLSRKYTITEVLEKKPLIEQMRQEDFYKELSQQRLEEIRQDIRELMLYLKTDAIGPKYSDIKDKISLSIVQDSGMPAANNETYKRRVERFIRENKTHIAITKLKTNKPITHQELEAFEQLLFDGEERGTKEDFRSTHGALSLGSFVRSIVGLDKSATQQAFADFIQSNNLTGDQLEFIDTLVRYLAKNGTIEKKMLVESPFNHQHDEGIFGVFPEEVMRIISIVDGINGNANVG